MLNVSPVRAFRDNYIWMLRTPAGAQGVVIVDPGDAAPVMAELDAQTWQPAAVLLTHHHFDHVGGVADLQKRYKMPVYGPDNPAIAGLSHPVGEGDTVTIEALGLHFEVMAIPGHTLDHIAYVGHNALFCGDTLFSAGCGRMFEGTPAQMQPSLARLRALDDHTKVYCGHEYTAANLAFAATVEPDNPAIDDYIEYVGRLTALDFPSLPSHIALEKQVNPFLRWDNPAVRAAAERHAGRSLQDAKAVWAALREWKDNF